MISAWDVYWVMQLDAIGEGLIFFGVMSFMISAITGIVALEFGKRPAPIVVPWLMVGVTLLSANMFLPSTKTAAAMIVLPALTSDDVIEPAKREASEVYALAKKALQDIADERRKDATTTPEN